MNINTFSSENSEFRNRFGGKKKSQTKWDIAEQTATDAANFFRETFESFRNPRLTPYQDDFKKKAFRNNIRYYAVYLGVFLLAIFIFAFYSFSGFSGSLKESIQNDALDSLNFDSDSTQKSVNQYNKSWRKKIFDLRPMDVINHKYDGFAISIILADDPSQNHLLHTSFKTFLRQINRIQICTKNMANTFVGGDHYSDIPFSPKSILFPKLERYIDGFLTMNVFSPHQNWYMQVDEDSYLFLENIYIYLLKFQSKDALFFHNFDLVKENSVHYQAKQSGHFPVSIMSRRAAEILAQSNYGECIRNNKYINSEETIMIKCLELFGVRTIAVPALHPSEPSHDFAWPVDSCKRPLSISQLSKQQLEYLYNVKPMTGSSSHDGSSYKWDSIVTYSDVFHHTYASSKPVSGIDRHSASDSNAVLNIKSGMECMEACKSDKDCLSWTFDRSSCFTSSHIGASIPRKDVVSGVIPTRYNCLAPQH